MFEGWDRLDWLQRRERRFQRWLSGRGVEFADDAARQQYRRRVKSLVDAIRLKTPERLPISLNAHFYVAKHSGLTKKEAMYDYEKMAAALIKFHEDFRPDFQAKPAAPAKVFGMLDLRFIDWPGRGLPDETPWQYLEGEYMREDEYDALLADPEGYFRRSLLPRFGSAFGPLAAMPPFTDFMEAAAMPYNLLGFASPGLVEGVQRLAEAAGECFAWLKVTGAAQAYASGRLGIPPEWTCSAKAPYDVLADTLRGTKGIMIDRFRQPDNILAAAERFVPLMIDMCVRQGARADSPLVVFWLHKGADGFMSEADFRTFYWPTLKAVIKGLVEQGLVPALFAQGSYNKRLDIIADDELPAGSVLWMFDQTDMAAAKRTLSGYACIAGNVPTALLAVGSAVEVEDYVTDLLDACAKDGGFYLRNGAALDDGKAENLRAMIETGRNWEG
jgi:Holliday junction resolvase RusA-like endonuclease